MCKGKEMLAAKRWTKKNVNERENVLVKLVEVEVRNEGE